MPFPVLVDGRRYQQHGTAMLSMSVAEYDIADVRSLFGEGSA